MPTRSEPSPDGMAQHPGAWSGLLEARRHAVDGISRGQSKSRILTAIAAALEGEAADMHIAILTADPEGAYLHCRAAPSLPAAQIERLAAVPIAPDVGGSGAAAWHATRVVGADRRRDPNRMANAAQFRSMDTPECWSQPVLGLDGGVIAVLTVHTRTQRNPPDGEVAYIERACDVVGMVLDQLSRTQTASAPLPDDEPCFNQIPAGLFRTSVQTDAITYANETLAHMLGYQTARELRQQAALSEIYADPTQRRAVHGRAAREGAATGEEVCLRCRDGSRLTGLLDMRAVYASDQTLAAFEGVVRNVTEQKNSDQRFFRAYELYRLMFEHSPLGTMVIDRNHNITLTNHEVERTFGYDSNEMIGTPIETIVPHLAQRQDVFDQHAGDADQSPTAGDKILEVNGLTRAAHIVPVQVSVQSLNHVREDHFLVSVRDISRRHEALKAMRDEEEKFRQVFDHAGIGIALFDLNKCIIASNPAIQNLLNYSESELYQRHFHDFTHGDDITISDTRMKHLADGFAESDSFEKRYVTKTGEVVSATVTASVVRTQNGEPWYFVVLVEDITQQKRMFRDLHQSREKFRRLFEDAGMAIAIVDLDGGLRDVNPKMQRMLGYQRDSLRGIHFDEVTYEEDRQKDLEQFDRLRNGVQDTYGMEKRYVCSDGSVIWGKLTASLVRDASGAPEYALGLVEDITEQKHTEQALREREREARELFEQSPVGLFREAPDDTYMRVNPAFARLLGYLDPEHVVHQVRPSSLHADADRREHVRACLREHRSVSREPLPFRLKSGETRWVLLDIRPIFDEHGALRLYEGAVQDITERKHLEHDLEAARNEAENAYSLLYDAIESLPNGFAVYDSNDRLRICNENDKKIYSLSADMMVPGTHFEDIIREGVRRGQYQQAIGNEESWIAERLAQHRAGETATEQQLNDGRWLFIEEHRTRDGGTVGVRTDITELMEAKQKAEASDATKTAFLANMSHELRTPLNAILGMSEIIRDGVLGENIKRYAEYARDINDSGVYLKGLIEDLLDLTQLESGNYTIREAWIDTSSVIRRCQRMVAGRAEAAGVALEVAAEAPPIRGDERALQQILSNLLSNAIKYAGQGARIELAATRPPDGSLAIVIRDDGPGMDAADLERIVQPFERGKQTYAAQNQEGSGLGLAISHNFMRLHGGRLEVDSNIGEGTTVAAVFPPDRVSLEKIDYIQQNDELS